MAGKKNPTLNEIEADAVRKSIASAEANTNGELVVVLARQTLNVFLRYLLTKKEMEQHLRKAAEAQFIQQKIGSTRGATGILLYISFAERRVIVLGDSAINDKVHQDDWNQIVTEITSRIKAGKTAEAICAGIEKAGVLLSRHFPATSDNHNELDDRLIQI